MRVKHLRGKESRELLSERFSSETSKKNFIFLMADYQHLTTLKGNLHDAEMIEFEDRVGFKSMERNAGVWGER